jgi:hypothetical protein
MVKKAKPVTEKIIHQQICSYINLQYPNVIYTSDASGMRLTIGLRMEAKAKRCNRYVIPDLIILQPVGGFFGLLLEIKRSRKDLYKKDGTFLKCEHIEAQAKAIEQLNEIGYSAGFVCGFEEAKTVIDAYFKAV